MLLSVEEIGDTWDDSDARDLVTVSKELLVSAEIKELDELLVDETKV